MSSASVAAIAVWQTLGRLSPGIHLATPSSGSPIRPDGPEPLAGAINVLLVGTDTRTDQGNEFADEANQGASSGVGQNDVTMILHIAADHSNATVISIPRDTMLPVPECPSPVHGSTDTIEPTDLAMFNTTLERGGLPCTVLTAEKLTGLRIPFAAIINFEGVKAMSTAVGGVSVCVASPIDDSDTGLHLDAGQQELVGESALQFVRTRHGVGDGSDLDRITDQQIFLSALMRKVTSAGVLSNPITLYSLANAVTTNLELSDTLQDPARLVSIALAVKGIALNRLSFVRYPVVADPDDHNRVIPDEAAMTGFNESLRTDRGIAPTTESEDGSSTAPEPEQQSTPPDARTGTPTASAAVPAPGPLPDNVTGQTADETGCALGN